MSDLEDTILSATAGDPGALEALLARFLPELRAFTRLHMGPLAWHESSSDLVQSVCREVLQHLDGFEYRGEAAFRKWLLVACTNRMRDRKKYWVRQARDARRTTEMTDSAAEDLVRFETPSGELIRQEELRRLDSALARMPEEYREVITLSRLCGLSHKEIAEQRGSTEGATRMLLHRALARLGTELSGGAS